MLAKDMKTPQYQKENENIVLMCLLKATKEIDVPFSIYSLKPCSLDKFHFVQERELANCGPPKCQL